MKSVFASLILLASSLASQEALPAAEPLRLGMVGLVHGHAGGFLNRYLRRSDIRLVGIAEPDQAVSSRYAERFQLDRKLLFPDVDRMLDATRPEAVVIFTSTYDHPRVVEACAARGIPAMMEKPLAVSVEHALAIERAARKAEGGYAA